MPEEEERSILSKPPFNVLMNPEYLGRRKPWEIDISFLLSRLMEMLGRLGQFDLRFAGTAALSSSLIYRLKVERLFLFEKVKERRLKGGEFEVPISLRMPYRFDLPMSTFEELYGALRKILQEILEESEEKEGSLHVEPQAPIVVDSFQANIGEELGRFKSRLLGDLSRIRSIRFGEYTKGLEVIERVRMFILLLFVAMEGLVKVEQVEDYDMAISLAL